MKLTNNNNNSEEIKQEDGEEFNHATTLSRMSNFGKSFKNIIGGGSNEVITTERATGTISVGDELNSQQLGKDAQN